MSEQQKGPGWYECRLVETWAGNIVGFALNPKVHRAVLPHTFELERVRQELRRIVEHDAFW